MELSAASTNTNYAPNCNESFWNLLLGEGNKRNVSTKKTQFLKALVITYFGVCQYVILGLFRKYVLNSIIIIYSITF